MSIVYLNGEFRPAAEARVSVFDRGFLFGDGVYEVVRCFAGRPFAMGRHIERFRRTLQAVRIEGFDPAEIVPLSDELLRRNDLCDATAYWQVTRGAAPTRSHLPPPDLRPTVFGWVDAVPPLKECREPMAMSAIIAPDQRWGRCDIKSTNLLPNVLGRLAAATAGAQEVIFQRDGFITEGGATNVFIARGDEITTPPFGDGGANILHGVTRQIVMEIAPGGIVERPISVAALRSADEVMLSGTRTLIAAVTMLDCRPVGNGRIGPAVRRLLAALLEAIRSESNG